MLARLLLAALGVILLGCGDAERESAQGPEQGTVQVTVVLPEAKPVEPRPTREQRPLPAAGSVPRLGVLEGGIHGFVPDGVEQVRLTWGGRCAVAVLVDNVFEARLHGIAAGATVMLTVVVPGQPQPCAPSPALLRAVPALRADRPRSAPPEQLARVVDVQRRLVERWARVWGTGDGLTYWVVPELRCGVVTENDRACVAVVAQFVEGAVCASAADIAARGVSEWYPIGDRPVIVGFAPTAVTAARGRVPGYDERTLPVRSGVFAGALAEGVPMDRPDAYTLSFAR